MHTAIFSLIWVHLGNLTKYLLEINKDQTHEVCFKFYKDQTLKNISIHTYSYRYTHTQTKHGISKTICISDKNETASVFVKKYFSMFVITI